MNMFLNKEITGTRRYIYYAILLFLLYEFLAKNFGLNRNFCYIVEFFSIILLFRHPYKLTQTGLYIPFNIMVGLFAVTVIGAIINTINPVNYIFGFRGQFLSMVFLFACAAYLRVSDYHRLFDLFYKFQYLNVVCTLFQFFVFHYTEDFNNGAFTGGHTQDFFCGALMTYYFYSYNQKKVGLYKLIFVLASSMLIAVIQDERFIFVEAGIIFLYFAFMGKLNIRKIFLAVIMAGVIVAGFSNLSSGQAQTLNSTANLLEYSQTAGAGYGFPRIGSAKMISDMFFHTPAEEIFGIGLGKATETKVPLIDTSFFDRYGHLAYSLFSFQNVFLQTGWSGIVLYVSFFFSLLIYNLICKRKAPKEYKYLYDIAAVLSALSIILIWYNASLRVYYGIFPYFALGIGPCITKSLKQKNKSRKAL